MGSLTMQVLAVLMAVFLVLDLVQASDSDGFSNVVVGRPGSMAPGKRTLALGRFNFRPGKRSLALGRFNFRPGKRSGSSGSCSAESIKEIMYAASVLQSELQGYVDLLDACDV